MILNPIEKYYFNFIEKNDFNFIEKNDFERDWKKWFWMGLKDMISNFINEYAENIHNIDIYFIIS